MTFTEFKRTLKSASPPRGLAPALKGLWWAGKDEWDKAHKIVMDDDSREAAWVHAYLHRREGDVGNAGYRYRQAKKPTGTGTLEKEWQAIVTALLERGND